jgi:RHS repeat-associated protein
LTFTTPGGARSRFEHEPLATVKFDEEDSDGPFAGTPERTTRDGLGRVAVVERLLTQGGPPARMTYRYDSTGNIARVTDAAGHTKLQTFDLLGRAVSVSDPNSGTTLFSRDAAGNLVQRTDASGQVVVSVFDGLNRKVAEFDPKDEAATRFEWLYDRDADCSLCTNGAGREVGVRFPVSTDKSQGSDRSGYDTRGRRVWFARNLEGHDFITQYAFDSRDLPIKTTHPDGTVLETKRDLAGRVTSAGGALTSLEYSSRGKPSKATYANGVVATWERDEREWLSGLEVNSPKSGKLLKLSYTRDRVGHVTSVSDGADKATDRPGRGATYEYDAWYRLTSADLEPAGAAAEKLSFGYDEIDNITSRTSSNPQSPANVGPYTYDAAHPNAAVSAGSLELQYDVTGDMVQRGGRTQEWDHLGRLIRVTDAEGNVAGAVHNGQDRRVMKLEGGGVIHYASDSFEIRDGIGVTYTTLGNRRLSRSSTVALATTVLSDVGPGGAPDGAIDISDAWLAQAAQAGVASLPAGVTASPVERLLRGSARRLLLEASEPTVYLHHDALGSVVAATGADGSVLGEQDFYPNGQRRAENGHVDAYGFAGYEEDGEAGTWHTKRRELDPLLGRWLSVDPAFELIRGSNSADALAEMLSGYAYVGNDLVNAIDPAGTKKTSLNSKKPKLTKQQKGRQKQEKMRRKENKAIAKGFKSSGTDADKNVTSAYGNYKIHKINKRARTVGGAIGSLALLGGTIATVSISIKDLIENKSPGPGNDTSDDDATPPEDGSDSQSPEFSDPQGGAEDLPFDTSGMDPSGGQSLSEDTEQPGGKSCSGGGGSSGPTEIGVVLSCN